MPYEFKIMTFLMIDLAIKSPCKNKRPIILYM